ncbi:MAG: hypothetical protein EB003_08710 [Flavobacteriia bacterium]|nr:hypothetical protein [Flavobacteriia bacterium]
MWYILHINKIVYQITMLIKKIVHFILLATIFILPAFALIVVDSYFFPFITGKAFFFRILVEIAFASWIILAFIDPKYRPKITPLSIGVTIFAVVALIADFLGVNPLRSIWSNFERMEGWITIVHLWALFIVFSNTFGFGEEGKRIWQRWINAELFIAFIVSIYAIVQLAGGAEIHQGSRVDASLGNAAYMAVYMLFNVGLAAYMSVIVRMKKIIVNSFLKWMYPVLSILFGFILFETATRGTILGLFGGLMLALAIYSIFGKDESKKSRLISGGIIFAIILVGIVFWMNKDASFIQKNEADR